MKRALLILGMLLVSAPCFAQTNTSSHPMQVISAYQPQTPQVDPLGPTPYEWAKTIPHQDGQRCVETLSGRGMIVQECK